MLVRIDYNWPRPLVQPRGHGESHKLLRGTPAPPMTRTYRQLSCCPRPVFSAQPSESLLPAPLPRSGIAYLPACCLWPLLTDADGPGRGSIVGVASGLRCHRDTRQRRRSGWDGSRASRIHWPMAACAVSTSMARLGALLCVSWQLSSKPYQPRCLGQLSLAAPPRNPPPPETLETAGATAGSGRIGQVRRSRLGVLYATGAWVSLASPSGSWTRLYRGVHFRALQHFHA